VNRSIPAPEELLHAAQNRTGLSDFGDEAFREGFDLLVEEIDALGFPADTAAASAHHIGRFLDARLMAIAGWKANPSCLDVKIERPLIIAGIVRSGTTALHHLLSLDEQFQIAEHWLTAAPMPRPPRERWADVPSYRLIAKAVADFLEVSPELAADHMMSAEGAEESIYIHAQTFASNLFPSSWDLVDYDRWYRGRDDTASYKWLADVLRLIGSGSGPGRWLLKNPTDLFSMEEVLNVFPDAMIIQTHRDPIAAIPSICSLMYAGRRTFMGERADRVVLGARESRFWVDALERAERARRRAPQQFFDVEFDAFAADQMSTVRAVYDYFGLTLSAAAEKAMRAWLAKHPRRSTAGAYDPEAYGLSAEALAELYVGYRRRRGYASGARYIG
jgi:hypothetical protein